MEGEVTFKTWWRTLSPKRRKAEIWSSIGIGVGIVFVVWLSTKLTAPESRSPYHTVVVFGLAVALAVLLSYLKVLQIATEVEERQTKERAAAQVRVALGSEPWVIGPETVTRVYCNSTETLVDATGEVYTPVAHG